MVLRLIVVFVLCALFNEGYSAAVVTGGDIINLNALRLEKQWTARGLNVSNGRGKWARSN